MADEPRLDPENFAHRMVRRAALAHGGTATDDYVRRVVEEVLGLCPGVRDSLVDDLMAELKEEIARREDPKYAHATVELITRIEKDWRNYA